MARMRTIKPGFFNNEHLLECEPLARILFEGLWCWADRDGRLEDRPKRLKIDILPADNCDVGQLLDQLANANVIVRYQVGEGRYIQVLKFLKHQRPHKKEASFGFPPPPGFVAPSPDLDEDEPEQGTSEPGKGSSSPETGLGEPAWDQGSGIRDLGSGVMGSGEGDPGSCAGAPAREATTTAVSLRSPGELAPQRGVLAEGGRDGEAGTVEEERLGAAPLVEANGWRFAPDDVAALSRAAENVTTPPLEMPITIRGRLMKRVQQPVGDPQRFDQAVLDLWDAMAGDQLARWIEAGMNLALLKKGREDRGGLLALAAGIIGQALSVNPVEDLPATAARRLSMGVASPPSSPASPEPIGWRSWLTSQRGCTDELYVMRVVGRELPAGVARYAKLFWTVRDEAVAELGDSVPQRRAAEERARDRCLQELWDEIANATVAAGGAR